MNFIDKYHIIRRALLIVFTYFFLTITYRLFCDGVVLDTFKVSAYAIFAGMETLIIKFYHNSRDIETKNNEKVNGEIKL